MAIYFQMLKMFLKYYQIKTVIQECLKLMEISGKEITTELGNSKYITKLNGEETYEKMLSVIYNEVHKLDIPFHLPQTNKTLNLTI